MIFHTIYQIAIRESIRMSEESTWDYPSLAMRHFARTAKQQGDGSLRAYWLGRARGKRLTT